MKIWELLIKEPNEEEMLAEPINYFRENKHWLIKISLMIALIALVILVGWKVTTLQKEVLVKKDAIRRFHKKISKIEQKDIEDMEISWKDQKEGISKILLLFIKREYFFDLFYYLSKSLMSPSKLKLKTNFRFFKTQIII